MEPGQTLVTPPLPTITYVLRTLKREENSLFNCVASCLDDAEFVAQISRLYGTLPKLANLRCGLWYLEGGQQPVRACYFKSTDGHNGNWSFSTTRLNLAVAEAAAASQGCVIVDATRRGKTFPDALTKTVPIWAAVLNGAIHRLRSQQQQQGAGGAHEGTGCNGGCDGGGDSALTAREAGWDTDVHLPPWISDNERHQIQSRLEGWVDQLLGVGADLSGLLRKLRKPLRCIWISQDSRIWVDDEAAVDTSGLGFTPLVLVSASLPNARERRQLTLPPKTPAPAPAGKEEDEGEGEEGEGESLTVVYDYVPGAGDDEESWARGLTPELMWRHKRELLAAGRGGIEGVVRRLLAEQLQQAMRAPAPQRRQGREEQGQEGAAEEAGPGEGPGAAAHSRLQKYKAAHRATPAATTASSLLAPVGCRRPATADGAEAPPGAGATGASPAALSGICFLGDTGLAVGAARAGAPPLVWTHVDAVLNVGLWECPGITAADRGASCSQLASRPEDQDLPAGAHAPASGAEREGSPGGHPVPPHSGRGGAACLPRYKWLPVPHHKFERHGLRAALPEAVAFVSGHLQAGRRVLVHCDDGLDTSVCVILAVLLACFRLAGLGDPTAPTSGLPQQAVQAQGAPTPAAGSAAEGRPRLAFAQPYTLDAATGTPLPADPAGFGKLSVRRHLAALAAWYLQARPTQGMLRQVYNLFVHNPHLPPLSRH